MKKTILLDDVDAIEGELNAAEAVLQLLIISADSPTKLPPETLSEVAYAAMRNIGAAKARLQ